MDTIVKRIREVARNLGIGEGIFELSVGMSKRLPKYYGKP